MPQVAAELESAHQAEEQKPLREGLHRLAGTAASYGFPLIAELTERSRTHLREGSMVELNAVLPKLIAELRSTADSAAAAEADVG